MASAELTRLWKLAEIDNRIQEIKTKAAALDVGQKLQAEIELLEKQLAKVSAHAKTLSQELTDLELEQKSLEQKAAKFDADLYGGKITNAKEVESIQKEIVMLKRLRDERDGRLLELIELVPPAKAEVAKVEKAIAQRKAAIAERRKQALVEKTQLEAAYKDCQLRRPVAEKNVGAGLLARYDGIRQRYGGLGMAEVDTTRMVCRGCGTSIPERTLAVLREDKVLACETCHRLLYLVERIV